MKGVYLPPTSGIWMMADLLVLFYSRKVRESKFPDYIHLLIKDQIALNPATATEASGSWDSIHVFESSERGRQAHYKLTSTIMLNMVTRSASSDKAEGTKKKGEIGLSGSMTRQVKSYCYVQAPATKIASHSQTEHDWPLHDTSSHITNTGRMIEDMEIKMRGLLQEVRHITSRAQDPPPDAYTGVLWKDQRRCL